jgi:hypothetical protein
LPAFSSNSHGLVSASHLNGELGEVRNVEEDESGMVRFEKKGVKTENLRIVFELPNEV